MVDFTLLTDFPNMTLTQFFQYPTTGDPWFYLIFIFGIVFIVSSIMHFFEVNRKGEGNFMSSLAVSSFFGIVLLSIGSLFGLTTVLITIIGFILLMIPIALWWFGGR